MYASSCCGNRALRERLGGAPVAAYKPRALETGLSFSVDHDRSSS